ncbi:uncharacterized protein BJ212DRAFT_1324554 [Suillus subaureus]|uniref:Uncharacterized protein n=1 Tax=Suillus subaureus TaxID=48587 RepID=A0A9P7EJC4_9AGAM|nr:uncharacterized protein BJ212DRAFT_1324554 [Suillus subaureus]KAG1823490.1 hypothetical protein BJ212DRAFT_1324554 [Suillus subaureus]
MHLCTPIFMGRVGLIYYLVASFVEGLGGSIPTKTSRAVTHLFLCLVSLVTRQLFLRLRGSGITFCPHEAYKSRSPRSHSEPSLPSFIPHYFYHLICLSRYLSFYCSVCS